MFLNYGALNFKLHVHYLRRYLVLSSRHILCNTDKVCMYYVIFSFQQSLTNSSFTGCVFEFGFFILVLHNLLFEFLSSLIEIIIRYQLKCLCLLFLLILVLILANNPLFFPDRCLLHFTYLLCLLLIHLHPNLIVDIFACFLFDIRLCILKRSRSSVVVIEREQFKTVSHAVWVCWKAVTTEKTIKEK